jgi:hypothetical protein
MVHAVKDKESIRIRLGPDVKPPWERVLAEHKITQQQAVEALVRWTIEQDALTRAMVFGQVPATNNAELSRIVLRRLAAGGKKPKK